MLRMTNNQLFSYQGKYSSFAGCIKPMEVINIRQSTPSPIPRNIMEPNNKDNNNVVTSRQDGASPSQTNGKQPFNIDFKWQPPSPTRNVMNEPFPFIAYLLNSFQNSLISIISSIMPHLFQITHDNLFLQHLIYLLTNLLHYTFMFLSLIFLYFFWLNTLYLEFDLTKSY